MEEWGSGVSLAARTPAASWWNKCSGPEGEAGSHNNNVAS